MDFITKQFKHQDEVFNKIKDLEYYALFWDMGTGKSKSVIDLIRYKYYQEKNVLKTLIIAPNISLDNWRNEFKLHSRLEKHVEILQGSKNQRIEKINNIKKRIFIINYEGVSVIFDTLLKANFDVIICDESQRIKNIRSKRTKLIICLGKKSAYRYILSGTPILNSPMDIYSQYLFLDGGMIFGTNFYSFRNTFFEDANLLLRGKNYYFPKWTLKPDVTSILHHKVSQIADFKEKKYCLDLPNKVYQALLVDMTKKQLKAYKEMKKELICFFKNNPATASNAAVKLIRLNQITSGFIKAENGKELHFESSPKIKVLKELLEDLTISNKIIIWAVFRNNIKQLVKELKQYNPAVIYGDTRNKQSEQDKFKNDNSCRVFIGNPQSCGLAINLISANYAVYFSYNYSLEQRLQSEDRCHRIGSEKHNKITYIDLICRNSIDAIILDAIKSKSDIAKKIIGALDD